MSIRLIADSCCEFPEEIKKEFKCVSVPLILSVDDTEVVDDGAFDQKSFLKLLAGCKGVPRSACPSPESFLKAYEGEGEPEDEEWVFVVTLSSFLSGSYNSAELAKELYEDEHKDEGSKRRIHVFDSKTASGGEAQVMIKAAELYKEGKTFDEIVEKCEDYISNLNTPEYLFRAGVAGGFQEERKAFKYKGLRGKRAELKARVQGRGRCDRARGHPAWDKERA